MLRKVGITKLGYDDIEYDEFGWAEAEKFTPAQFDLVKIKTKDKTFNGWYTGDRWIAVRFDEKKDKILQWKKIREIYA